jgi:hypothetical protein
VFSVLSSGHMGYSVVGWNLTEDRTVDFYG